jgi:hypothetical protein
VTPAHFIRNHDVGGDLVSNVNVRLENAERMTGIGISFSRFFVFSLNCLQNSAMFIPKGPSAYCIKIERYTYIYIYRERERERKRKSMRRWPKATACCCLSKETLK